MNRWLLFTNIAVCSSGDDSEYSEGEDEQDMKMVLVVRNDLKMGKGKVRCI